MPDDIDDPKVTRRDALKLAGANARVRELFELTNLLSVFDVYPTLDDALMAFQRQVAKGETAVHAA